uniref:Uncharacterized protein n=1 Tax=Vespula pensylvanica TaxID=30213 RepID=A0A834U936_VESPE|nr:hypothetical protein H0235_008421 [Vespula pensylvanica]
MGWAKVCSGSGLVGWSWMRWRDEGKTISILAPARCNLLGKVWPSSTKLQNIAFDGDQNTFSVIALLYQNFVGNTPVRGLRGAHNGSSLVGLGTHSRERRAHHPCASRSSTCHVWFVEFSRAVRDSHI